jgi:hypothetical protein
MIAAAPRGQQAAERMGRPPGCVSVGAVAFSPIAERRTAGHAAGSDLHAVSPNAQLAWRRSPFRARGAASDEGEPECRAIRRARAAIFARCLHRMQTSPGARRNPPQIDAL